MKWVLFLLSPVALFAANNALFWVPGRYDWFTAVAAGTAISTAAVLAWFSSKKFVGSTSKGQAPLKDLLMAPPAVVWLLVMLVFWLAGLLRITSLARGEGDGLTRVFRLRSLHIITKKPNSRQLNGALRFFAWLGMTSLQCSYFDTAANSSECSSAWNFLSSVRKWSCRLELSESTVTLSRAIFSVALAVILR